MHQHPRKIATFAIALVALAVTAHAARAQQTTNRRPPPPRTAEKAPRAKAAPITELDRYVLRRLSSFTEGQIALGQLAQEKAARPDVRQLAAAILQDHTGMQTLLQDALSSNTAQPLNKPAINKPATNEPSAAEKLPAGPASQPKRPRRSCVSPKRPTGNFRSRSAANSRQSKARRSTTPSCARKSSLRRGSSTRWRSSSAMSPPDLKPLLQRWIQIAQYDLNQATRLEMWIAQVGPKGATAGGIFGPRTGAATSGSAISGPVPMPRARFGLSPLPTTTTTPSGRTVGPAQGSP